GLGAGGRCWCSKGPQHRPVVLSKAPTTAATGPHSRGLVPGPDAVEAAVAGGLVGVALVEGLDRQGGAAAGNAVQTAEEEVVVVRDDLLTGDLAVGVPVFHHGVPCGVGQVQAALAVVGDGLVGAFFLTEFHGPFGAVVLGQHRSAVVLL